MTTDDERAASGPPATDWASGQAGDRELRPHRVLEAAAEWRADFERDENLARTGRLKAILVWGGLAYLSFLPTDVLFNVLRESGLERTFVVARLLGVIPLVLLWLRLDRGPTASRRQLMLFEALATGSVAAEIALTALLSGAIGSPILAGLTPVLVARAVGIPEPWRRGLLLAGAPAATFWLIVIVGSLAFPQLVEADPRAIAALLVHVGIHVVALALLVVGGHMAWDLRRNLYKARHVGRYELLRPLGRGQMGEVWVAWHQGLRQEVALKILPIDPAGSSNFAAVERFEREVLATTKLRHPNTVRVYDFGLTAEGLWYYAMELLDGETAAELVGREGPLSIPRALDLIRQAARALREAHAHGIVHRDIKPDNLFVSAPAGERDVIRVLDFGVATIAAEALLVERGTEPVSLARDGGAMPRSERDPTEPGFGPERPRGEDQDRLSPERAVGTPLYISPEAACGRPTDGRADIYGLGGVLYFMLTGRPPFIERDAASLLRAHVEKRPDPPSVQLATPLPDYVDKLVLRCLAKDPAERYPDADALVRAIDLCLRLGENDRRRGEAQQPRRRMSPDDIEALADHSRTDTDMSLIKD